MITTDVLIVGSGPAGGAASLFLSTYGVDNVVLTRYGWTANTPRAHITNQRTIELMRDMGIEDQVIDKGTEHALMGETAFCTSLAGEEIGRIRTWGTHPRRLADYTEASPTLPCDLPQTLFEPILLSTAASRGARLRFNTEYLSLEQDDDGVTATVRDRLSDATYQIRAKYLIGADGGRSKVAQDIGLPMAGAMDIEGSMNIVFEADLSRYVAHRPSVLYWVLQPGAQIGGIGAGLVRMVRPWNEWLIVWGYDINQPAPEVDEAMATEIVHNLVGDDTHRREAEEYVGLERQPHVRRKAQRQPGVLHGRRDPPAPAEQRPRLEHLDPGRVQPGLEALPGPQRPCVARAPARRTTRSGCRSPSRSWSGRTRAGPSSARSSGRSG